MNQYTHALVWDIKYEKRKVLTISEFTALKNNELLNAKYYDERLDRFMEALEGFLIEKMENMIYST